MQTRTATQRVRRVRAFTREGQDARGMLLGSWPILAAAHWPLLEGG